MQLDTVTQATVVHEVLGKLCQMQAIPNIEIYVGTKGSFCLNLSLLQSHLAVSLGRELHILQLDNPDKVDWIYQLLTALGQAPGLPAVHVYVQGPTTLQLAQFPDIVATKCQLMRLGPNVSSEQLHNIKDFSSLIKHDGRNVLLLPCGEVNNSNRVSLETFKLTAPCVVRNLAFATELRLIDMAPISFTDSDVDWPMLLPKLERFEDCISDFGHPIHDLPHEWIGYSNLTHICLNNFEADHLPVWFSSLQHLKSLDMSHAKFPQFPTCMSAMSGLEHLELRYLDTYLSQEILMLALLPRLTTLSFGNFSAIGRRLDNEEVLNLKRLEVFCWAHPSGTPLLQQGDEGDWDFEAASVQYLEARDKVKLETLLKRLSDLYAE
ncbi:hypothetical protein WJX82_008422 [Trebouxia sp. C0006]